MNEDYYKEKKDKRNDFILGVLINVGVAFGAACIYAIIYMAQIGQATNLVKTIAITVAVILTAVVDYILIKRYLKKRRYLAIGMITGIIVPLLILGTCSPFLFNF